MSHMEKPEGKYAWTVTVGTKGQILADAKQGMAIPPKGSFDEYFRKIFG